MENIEVTVREAVPADAGDITACVRRAYQRFERRMGHPPAPMLQDYRQVIHAARVWVATSGGRLLGVLVLSETSEGFLLENVAVDPMAQGRGVGKRLLLLSEELARAAGHELIHLYTNILMVENRVLYERFGYREYDTRDEQDIVGYTCARRCSGPKSQRRYNPNWKEGPVAAPWLPPR